MRQTRRDVCSQQMFALAGQTRNALTADCSTYLTCSWQMFKVYLEAQECFEGNFKAVVHLKILDRSRDINYPLKLNYNWQFNNGYDNGFGIWLMS